MQNNFKFFGSHPHSTKMGDKNVLGLPQNKNVLNDSGKNNIGINNGNSTQVSSFFNAGPTPQA